HERFKDVGYATGLLAYLGSDLENIFFIGHESQILSKTIYAGCWIPDFVSDASGQLADGCQTLAMSNLGFEPFHFGQILDDDDLAEFGRVCSAYGILVYADPTLSVWQCQHLCLCCA